MLPPHRADVLHGEELQTERAVTGEIREGERMTSYVSKSCEKCRDIKVEGKRNVISAAA